MLTLSVNADWPMPGGSPNRHSYTPAEVKGKVNPAWYVTFKPYISRKVQPIIVDGLVYISTAEGLFAIDTATEKVKWQYKTELPLGHSPAVVDGIAYVGCYDKKIHAIDAKTGKKIWTSKAADGGFHCSPLVAEGLVVAGCRDGNVYAYDAKTGKEKWRFKTGAPVYTSAAYQDGIVYIPSQDMHAYAINAKTGKQVWKSEKLPGEGFHSWWPVVYKDWVIFTGASNLAPGYPGQGNYLDRQELMDLYPEMWPPGVKEGWKVKKPKDLKTLGPIVKIDGVNHIDATRALKYYEKKPWRRNVFWINKKTGKEMTLDIDKDGKVEYPPFLYFGTKNATRFPPVVDAKGNIYQTAAFQPNKWICRGGLIQWKVGTKYFRTFGNWADDEPVGYLIGGNNIYYQQCVDRTAGMLPLDGNRGVHYYFYGNGNFYLKLPQMWNKQYPYTYHKHNDQSPPIPYKGKIYMITNNALICWSKEGGAKKVGKVKTKSQFLGIQANKILHKNVQSSSMWRVTADNKTWPELLQQEVYYKGRDRDKTRYAKLLTIAASGTPASVAQTDGKGIVPNMISAKFAGGELTCKLWRESPTVLVQNTGKEYKLTGKIAGMAYAGGVASSAKELKGSDLKESWLLVWASEKDHRWSPFVISLQKKPTKISFKPDELVLTYPGKAGILEFTPFYGLSNPLPDLEKTWAKGLPADIAKRCSKINRFAKSFMTGRKESFKVDDKGDAVFEYQYKFDNIKDDWRTKPLQVALLPWELSLAAYKDSPIKINGQSSAKLTDLQMPVPMGRVSGVENTDKVSVVLPGITKYWRKDLPTPKPPAANDPLAKKLVTEVQKMLDAGLLRPGFRPTWTALMPDFRGTYFSNPADTVFTLTRCLPLLPKDMQPKVKARIQKLNAKYPVDQYINIGWLDGAPRECFDLAPESIADIKEGKSNRVKPARLRGGKMTPWNFYAASLLAQDSANPKKAFQQLKTKLPKPNYDKRMAISLQENAAAHIGLLQLGKKAGVPWAKMKDIEEKLVKILITRAARVKNLESIKEWDFEYASPIWDVSWYTWWSGEISYQVEMIGCIWGQFPDTYGIPNDINAFHGGGAGYAYYFNTDWLRLIPELGAFVHDYAGKEATEDIKTYGWRAPYWFVPWVVEYSGEGGMVPLYDTSGQFQAKAKIDKASREELEKYIDVPGFKVGDLYYIQNLCSALEAEK